MPSSSSRPESRSASDDAPTGEGTTLPNGTRAGADANGVPFAAADALRAFHARAALVWMEYPAPHFRDGLGEFEDLTLTVTRTLTVTLTLTLT